MFDIATANPKIEHNPSGSTPSSVRISFDAKGLGTLQQWYAPCSFTTET